MSPERSYAYVEPHLTPIQKTNLSDEVISRIMRLLADGALKPGEQLPAERDLAARLGVGRSSLREALKSLTLMGILEVRPGEGRFVRPTQTPAFLKSLEFALLMGRRHTQELVEARFILEPEIAALAAERATPEDLDQLEATMQRMRAAVLRDPERFVDSDVEFHVVLARAARNSVLFHVMQTIRELLHVWIDRVARMADNMPRTVEEHEGVLAAVRARNGPAARDAMARHLRRATERLLEVQQAAEKGALHA